MKSLMQQLPVLVVITLSATTMSCSTVPVDRNYPSLIDLNNIKMEAGGSDDAQGLTVMKNEEGQYFLALNLTYKDSGINVIESIKNGRIIKTSIVIRDETGREIGSEPINFQAFEVEKTTTQVEKKTYLSTRQGDKAEFQSKKMEPVARYKFYPKQYSDNEPIPQIILLDELPREGSWISVVVELVYIAPFLAQSRCLSSTQPCPENDDVFADIERDNNEVLNDIKREINRIYEQSQVNGSGIIELPVFKLKNSEDYYVANMEKKIAGLNKKYADKKKWNRLVFRQWNLICAPRYFKIRIGKEGSAYSANVMVLEIIPKGPVAVCELQNKAGPFPKKTKISFVITDNYPRLKNLHPGEMIWLTFKIDRSKKFKDRYPVTIVKVE